MLNRFSMFFVQEKIESNPLDPQLEVTLQEKKETKIRREEQLNQKEQIERELGIDNYTT